MPAPLSHKMARVAGRLFFTVGLVVCAVGSAPQAGEPFTRIQALFADDFRGGLSRWASESEAPGKVEAVGGILSIDVPAGSTLWFRPELKGSVIHSVRSAHGAGGWTQRARRATCLPRGGAASSANTTSFAHTTWDRAATRIPPRDFAAISEIIGNIADRPLSPEHALRGPRCVTATECLAGSETRGPRQSHSV